MKERKWIQELEESETMTELKQVLSEMESYLRKSSLNFDTDIQLWIIIGLLVFICIKII